MLEEKIKGKELTEELKEQIKEIGEKEVSKIFLEEKTKKEKPSFGKFLFIMFVIIFITSVISLYLTSEGPEKDLTFIWYLFLYISILFFSVNLFTHIYGLDMVKRRWIFIIILLIFYSTLSYNITETGEKLWTSEYYAFLILSTLLGIVGYMIAELIKPYIGTFILFEYSDLEVLNFKNEEFEVKDFLTLIIGNLKTSRIFNKHFWLHGKDGKYVYDIGDYDRLFIITQGKNLLISCATENGRYIEQGDNCKEILKEIRFVLLNSKNFNEADITTVQKDEIGLLLNSYIGTFSLGDFYSENKRAIWRGTIFFAVVGIILGISKIISPEQRELYNLILVSAFSAFFALVLYSLYMGAMKEKG